MTSWLHANGDRGVWPRTFYAAGADLPPPFPPLEGRVEADLCVIGAGITGLSAALHAARAGLSVVVLEAQRVGWGASGRNGGQIGSGFNWSQRKLEARLGPRKARDLWDLAEEGKRSMRALLPPGAGYLPGVVSANRSAREQAAAAEDAAWMRGEYGAELEVLDRGELEARIGTRAYAGGVLDTSAGACDPLAYVLALSRACLAAGVTIHEGSEVRRAEGIVATAKGGVTARFVVHATNGYGARLAGVAGRVLPINNYVAVTEKLDVTPFRTEIAVADSQFVVNYFRPTADGRIVYGGGESYGMRFPSDIEGRVRRNLARVYPALAEVRFDHAWGGTLAVTATRLPLLAELRPGVFVAGGYSGHGLALAGLCGRLVAEAVLGERGRFDLMASLPVPRLPGGAWVAQAGMMWGALKGSVGVSGGRPQADGSVQWTDPSRERAIPRDRAGGPVSHRAQRSGSYPETYRASRPPPTSPHRRARDPSSRVRPGGCGTRPPWGGRTRAGLQSKPAGGVGRSGSDINPVG